MGYPSLSLSRSLSLPLSPALSLSNLYGVRHVLVQRTRAEGRITGVASFGLIVKD